jgi:hypothetical protein
VCSAKPFLRPRVRRGANFRQAAHRRERLPCLAAAPAPTRASRADAGVRSVSRRGRGGARVGGSERRLAAARARRVGAGRTRDGFGVLGTPLGSTDRGPRPESSIFVAQGRASRASAGIRAVRRGGAGARMPAGSRSHGHDSFGAPARRRSSLSGRTRGAARRVSLPPVASRVLGVARSHSGSRSRQR